MIVRKALKEGCCEREWAQTSVSSREKTNTKRNLARVTTSPKARHRHSLMNMSVKRVMIMLLESVPMSETS